LRGYDGLITSGTVSFKPSRFDGGGMRYLRFQNWLSEMDRLAGPLNAIYYEEVRRHIGTDASHVYGGLLAVLTAWAEMRGVPYQGVPVGTIKQSATGKGNASKAMMIEAARKRGFFVEARLSEAAFVLNRPNKNDLHPTMKPVSLVERAIRNSSRKGDLVFDPFGGSGTTLIAAEDTGRKAALLELDPKYVDVIVERWQRFTDQAAVLEDDGRSFDEIKTGREAA
jgi:DNA methylase